MISFNDIVLRLRLHEGFSPVKYKCPAGFTTIGIGHNLDANPIDVSEEISFNDAVNILRNDVKSSIIDLRRNVPFFPILDDERQYALLDMCFNLGIIKLKKFRKMLYAMEIGDYRGASKECLNSKYAQDVGIRAKRIANLIENGVWSVNV